MFAEYFGRHVAFCNTAFCGVLHGNGLRTEMWLCIGGSSSFDLDHESLDSSDLENGGFVAGMCIKIDLNSLTCILTTTLVRSVRLRKIVWTA